MTATTVGRLAVIADEPELSPITGKGGSPVYFKQIRRLLLEDGSTVVGCVHCDYTADSHTQVRPVGATVTP